MWAKQSLSTGARGNYSGIGERLAFGGVSGLRFGLAAASDPEIWTKISPAQQQWVTDTIVKLDSQIRSSTGTGCPTWNQSNISSITGCFQVWFNANYGGKFTGANGAPIALRSDGVFDQQTLDALRTVVGLNPKDFPTPYPGTQLPGLTGTGDAKLSKAAMAGIGIGAAAVLGGIVYAVKNKSRRK